jgi:hypothetical protein
MLESVLLKVGTDPAEPAHAEHEVPYYRRSRLLETLVVSSSMVRVQAGSRAVGDCWLMVREKHGVTLTAQVIEVCWK